MGRTEKSGFTIVELIIVIIVIGILATISIVAYNGVTARAQNTKVASIARQYIEIIELYNARVGRYPLAEAEYLCLPGTFPAKDGFALNSCEINGLAGPAAKQSSYSNNNPGQALQTIYSNLPDSSYGTVISGVLPPNSNLSQVKARGLIYTDDGNPQLLYHLIKTTGCPMGRVETGQGSNGVVCSYTFGHDSLN